jgi:hypothetical protein
VGEGECLKRDWELGIWEFGNLGKKGKKESIFWKNIDQKRK